MDLFLFQELNGLALKSFWFDVLGVYFAKYLEYLLLFCLLLFIFKNFRKYQLMILKVCISVAFARLVIVNLIRWVLPRARPFVDNQVNLLLEHAPTSSFPSGHASFYFAVATVVFLCLRKIEHRPKFWWQISFLFFSAALTIGIARVFCGIHWPSDILGGILVGIFSGWVINKIFQKYIK